MSNAGNPITSWIRNGMEPYKGREIFMRDRVGETSINAQKIVDERKGPFKSSKSISSTRKSKDFSHFYTANSSFKGNEEGCVNSFKALRFYQDEGANYRDQLLKEAAAQES